MIEAISSQSRCTDEVLILLDTETLKIGLTCRLVSRKLAQYFSVRSDFLSAQVALDAVLNGASNMQRLRNEAAMVGGVLRDYSASKGAIEHNQVEDVVQ